MSTVDLLADLRAGRTPAPEALGEFAAGLASGTVSDAQAGAFAMAVCCGNGLGEAGRVALTLAMAGSGTQLHWDLDGPVVDKHSTGGVGDPVSLVLAPMLAACGTYVPMISGRGLGHTGGTLDKLEAIPGVCCEVPAAAFRAMVGRQGLAIVAAGDGIAPADRKLYAVRDVTATVDQIDLITASILSKKLAAGLDALVLDVKAGRGAFMADRAAAVALARALVGTARGAGCPTTALVTAMDAPLAPACGNALEIAAVMEALRGEGGGPLTDVALALGVELLGLVGIDRARDRLERALASGAALERFAAMVAALGGPSDFAERSADHLPTAPVVRMVAAKAPCHVTGIDGAALGRCVAELGGGRRREGDRIDPSVGLDAIARIGAALAAGDPLCRIHAASQADADRAEALVRSAMQTGTDAPPPQDLILERIA